MPMYFWSALNDGDVFGVDYPSFDPDAHQLIFDGGISATDIAIDGTDEPTPFTTFSHGGKTITFDGVEPFELTSTNVQFANGSVLLIGDNTTAVPTFDGDADDAVNTLVGARAMT